MNRILVPCDFSAPSKEAVIVATRLAAKAKGEITLLYVIIVPLQFNPLSIAGIEESVWQSFESMKSELNLHDIKINLKITYGDMVLTAKNVIESEKITLVVMGTRGDSGLHELLIGSNTEKIVRYSPVPVLAVRTAFDLHSIKRILVPTTLALNQTEFMNYVKELQSLFDATLDILSINTPSKFKNYDQSVLEIEEFVSHYQLKNYSKHIHDYHTEEGGIIEFADSENIDMLAMATHARKGLAHLFNGSVTEKIVNRLDYPVWTFSLEK